ncbi:MAG: type II secretion system protein [Elusimicrobiaceae bacterium]|nr:type II secretion system protein [Elusimicrobiaceae bacterium]
MKNQAFTLIELLVVVLIIGILAAIALPQYQKAVVKAQLIKYIQYATSIDRANELYHLANDKYTEDVRDLDIDITGGATEFKRGGFTARESNVSAYYADGSSCGPDYSGGGACMTFVFGNDKEKRIYIYSHSQKGILRCKGYNDWGSSVCRSMAVNPNQTAESGYPTYDLNF